VSEASKELSRRWRLLLGKDSEQSLSCSLHGDDLRLDEVLSDLYEPAMSGSGGSTAQRGGLGGSAPRVTRWLGDIRRFFPASIVQILQRDAVERLNLEQLLLEPELLAAAQPDVHLAATLLTLNRVIPARTKATARLVVQRIVDDLMKRLEQPLRSAVQGALMRSVRNARPRPNEIDWHRTIKKNLHNYQPDLRTIIAERLVGFGRKGRSLRDVVLCIDQSGSMATSVVYSSIFGAVMASLPTVTTRMVVFDTAVVDLTEALRDPVDLLFGAQLGGGTDIHKALSYCEGLIERPSDTVMVLVSDLFEGGNGTQMLKTAKRLTDQGVRLIALLALSDDGTPSYDHRHAGLLAAMGVPVFGCTPDQFPELMAAALAKRDLNLWAASRGIALAVVAGD
jgi:hypothetical protein